ncbi:MAG: hypothetical protein NWF05_09740 [Candidatus Bathyarchaeota archaeon]|nr:hypothetical protein [Candidatus Bathyarchaeota archaeon]
MSLYLEPNAPLFKAVVSDLKLASEVPSDSKVYIFYIPGIVNYPELQKTLNAWGKTTGKNAFIGLLSADAPDYETIITYFQIKKSPAVVISGAPAFATAEEENNATTGFARIDNSKVLGNQTEIVECIQEIYNLFIQNKVKEAISTAKKEGFKQNLKYYLGKVKDSAGKAINEFLKNHDVSIDVFQGKIVVAPSAKPSASSAATPAASGDKEQKKE